ncbi:MAG: VOC family protein [Chloroflexota bacterium]
MSTYTTKIAHAHLKVQDLKQSIDFYQKFFNLNFVEQVGDRYAFLSGNDFHHEIALQQVGPNAPANSHPHAVGLYHIAFEVPSQHDFAMAYQTIKAEGIHVSAVDHRISWALYFKDPDGNGLEIYWDIRKTDHGKPFWEGETIRLTDEEVLAPLALA